VLHQAPQPEIRSLQVTADAVYVGTSAPSGRRRGNSTSASASDDYSSSASKLSATSVSRAARGSPATKVEAIPVAPTKSSAKDDDKDDKGKPASAPSSPGSGENSLYRIAADGTVREVFREKALILSVLRQPGKFFVGTGMSGQLFEV